MAATLSSWRLRAAQGACLDRIPQMATLGAAAVILASIAWALGTESIGAPESVAHTDGQRYNALFPSEQDALATCSVCHRVSADGPESSGPPLWAIVDANKGRSGWFGYSPALAAASGTWTAAAIDAYIADPVAYLPGTSKTLSQVRDADERKRVIDALQKLTP